MEKTLTWVAPEARAFEGQRGTTYYINVRFADGDGGSLGKQDAQKAHDLIQQLTMLIGTTCEYVLEDRGKKTQDGKTNWTIKGFPGYEAPSFAGGGGGGGGSFSGGGGRRSPEHQSIEQRCMNRRTALMQAVIVSKDADEALAIAGAFDAWLNEALPKQDAAAPLPPAVASRGSGSPSVAPAPTPSTPAGGGQGMTWTAPQAEGEAADSGPSGSIPHQHTWQQGNPGWQVCSECGLARKQK